MNKKVYRRLLMAALMLLISASLTFTSPTREIDPACCAACEVVRNDCRTAGGTRSACNVQYWNCIRSCNGGIAEICP